ncbi:MAG: RibD family protein [Proteobacteria bacterium]|nr:RibD family protein [Pseudomonadota bacterium]
MIVFSNLAISLDGKIADRSFPSRSLGTPYDRRMMQKIRNRADVVIIGSKTLETMKKPAKKTKDKASFSELVNAVVTSSGKLPKNIPFWNDNTVIRYVFTTQKGYRNALDSCKDRAFVVIAGESKVEIPKLLKVLAQCNLNKVLVEGGGDLMASFAEANSLNELYVTLTPWLIGGAANPTLIDGVGLKKWLPLRLKSLKRVGNELYFHYHVSGKRSKNG